MASSKLNAAQENIMRVVIRVYFKEGEEVAYKSVFITQDTTADEVGAQVLEKMRIETFATHFQLVECVRGRERPVDGKEKPWEIKQRWLSQGLDSKKADDPEFRFFFVFKTDAVASLTNATQSASIVGRSASSVPGVSAGGGARVMPSATTAGGLGRATEATGAVSPRAQASLSNPAAPAPLVSKPGLLQAQSLYDYNGSPEQHQVSFKKGDIITIKTQYPNGWWAGEVNGKLGYFPASYVKVLPKAEELTPPPPMPAPPPPTAPLVASAPTPMHVPVAVATSVNTPIAASTPAAAAAVSPRPAVVAQPLQPAVVATPTPIAATASIPKLAMAAPAISTSSTVVSPRQQRPIQPPPANPTTVNDIDAASLDEHLRLVLALVATLEANPNVISDQPYDPSMEPAAVAQAVAAAAAATATSPRAKEGGEAAPPPPEPISAASFGFVPFVAQPDSKPAAAQDTGLDFLNDLDSMLANLQKAQVDLQ